MTYRLLYLMALVLLAACTLTSTAEPHSPINASDSHDGVTVTVLEVAPHHQRIDVRLRVAWPDSDWEFYWTMLEQGPILRDDAGNEYAPVSNTATGNAVPVAVTRVTTDPMQTMTPNPADADDERTLSFAPLRDTAATLTLQIDALDFKTEAAGSFVVDLGPTPQLGQRWPLDVALDAAGFPVRITAVHLAEPEDSAAAGVPAGYRLVFDMEIEQQSERVLDTLLLNVAGPHRSFSGRYTLGPLRPSITLDTLPDGPFTVTLGHAGILVSGPWLITWPVSQTEPIVSQRVPIGVPDPATVEVPVEIVTPDPTPTPAICTPLPHGMRIHVRHDGDLHGVIDVEGLQPGEKPLLLLTGEATTAWWRQETQYDKPVGVDGHFHRSFDFRTWESIDGYQFQGQLIHNRGVACFPIDLRLPDDASPEGRTVHGRIVSEYDEGQPVSGVILQLKPRGLLIAETDRDGRFTLNNLPFAETMASALGESMLYLIDIETNAAA